MRGRVRNFYLAALRIEEGGLVGGWVGLVGGWMGGWIGG